MTDEQRFPLTDLHRVYVEVDVRDVSARWHEREDIALYGKGVDGFAEAGELFITSSRDRQFTKEPIEIELPVHGSLSFAVKAERGDVKLESPHGKLDLKLDNGDLELTTGKGSLMLSSGKGDLKINAFDGNITANSGSGDKMFNDVTGDVAVRSGRGETRMQRGSGAVEIMGASGDVVISDRDISRLNVTNASGDIVIRGGRLGTTVIETASGDIACDSPLTIASYDFTAASGDMALTIQRNLPARVDAATTRGSIDSALPLVAIPQRGPRNPHGKRVVGSTSDAAERAEITMRTTSGDIRLQWSNEAVQAPPPARSPKQEQPTTPIPVPAPVPAPAPAPAPVQTSNGDAVPHDLFDDDRRRVILHALADGSLSIEEASQLLEAMDTSAKGDR